ncbi:hypothetical protein LCI18_003177 [Fusarium solani-melongenae]|uniref:Uncharacterized protein n=1 Tax=Fusarium solani subsp. cucurbitae TaxID=2747967 RepID=A0ACD3YTL3_FUSSC|nr:hypothetical protein LCI18_003177 [Fusarium solani-melongenae]
MDVAESLRVSGDSRWAAAIGTLGDELKSQIDPASENKQKTLDELLAVAEQARKRLVDKSWSFKRMNGEVVFARATCLPSWPSGSITSRTWATLSCNTTQVADGEKSAQAGKRVSRGCEFAEDDLMARTTLLNLHSSARP